MTVLLHVKSDYSLGYGTASIQELVERAAELGYGALALTDLENLYGQVRFHHECRQRGIRAITGLELRAGFDGRRDPGRRVGRIVLLAQDEAGYRNLCRIVSLRRGGGPGKGECGDPVPAAERHSEGLFALSDDPEVIDRLLAGGRFPPDRVGFLLVRPGERGQAQGERGQAPAEPVPCGKPPDAAETAAQASPPLRRGDRGDLPLGDLPLLEQMRQRGVRCLADLDTVFLHRSDHPLHVLQLAIAQGRLMEEAARGKDVESRERWLRPPEGLATLFADTPSALTASEEIAAACTFQLGGGEGTPHVYDADAKDRDATALRQLCEERLSQLYNNDVPEVTQYRARLEDELQVYDALNFSGFMMMVAAILIHCRDEGILVAVRGSAVSSLVLHLLGGSPVDPLAHGLLFERFLHLGKTAWPDVDIDLPWDRRDEVIDWVYQRFGRDRVAMVAAHHTFRYRSALREGLKAWGAADALIESMLGAIPPDDLGTEDEVDFLDVAKGYQGGEGPDRTAQLVKEEPGLKWILPLVRRLVGRPRHVAVHPGGIVIAPTPLDGMVPLERAPKGVVITQYDLVAVAKLGLVKLDLLGNRCLSEIEEALALSGWDRPLRLESIPREDPATLDLIDRAATVGCFQLESPAMRSLLARLPIRHQSDLIAALALIRPGAAAGEVKNTFVRRARGEEAKEAAFPALADRLAETHGLPIYEEDIMVLLSRAGGITLAQADEIRRGIVKSGGDPATLSSLQKEFLASTQASYGDDRSAAGRARRAWAVAARFAAYSFNKAHAASYALLAYYSAFLKAHYPVEFACALLNHHQGLYPLRIEAAELERIGVVLRAPHVNESGLRSECRVRNGLAGGKVVRVGLDKVRNLSRRAASELVAARESGGTFATLRDLLQRVRLGVHEVSALVLAGACDGLRPVDAAGYPFIHEAVVERLRRKAGQADLELDPTVIPGMPAGGEERMRLYQNLVRVRNELLYLEMHLSAHPMSLLRNEARRYQCLSIAEAVEEPEESTVRIAAVIAAMRRVATRQGPMQFITLDDETGLLEAVIFPAIYRRLGERVHTPGPFLVVGKLRNQQGAVHLEVGRLEPFHERARAYQR